MKAPDTKIAVTLFNLREYCKSYEDLDETLGKVKDIGYEQDGVTGLIRLGSLLVTSWE